MPLRPLGSFEVLVRLRVADVLVLGILGANVLVLAHFRVADVLVLVLGLGRVLDLALRLALQPLALALLGPLAMAAYELVLGPVTCLAVSAAIQYCLARAPLAPLECGTRVAVTNLFSFRWDWAY